MRGWLSIAILAAQTSSITFAKPVIYVDAQSPAGVGTSWCHAYQHLQDALVRAYDLDAAVEIRVAAGTYTPDRGAGLTPLDRNATFRIPGGLTLLAGFAGCGAADPDERHLSMHETILSGDLLDDDAPGQSTCCIAGESPGCDDQPCRSAVCADRPQCCTTNWGDACVAMARLRCCDVCGSTCDNSLHVVTLDLLPDLPTHLDGLIIRGGNAVGGEGGGLSMPFEDRRPLVSRCLIENNLADSGAGAATRRSVGIRFEHCIFRNNVAFQGGALYTPYEPSFQLINCLLVGNHAAGAGGALYWEDAFLDWEITNSTFAANSASIGGAIYSKSRIYPDDRVITNSVLWGNRAPVGPQIALDQFPTYLDVDSLALINSIIQGGPSQVFTTPGYSLVWTATSADADPLFLDPSGPDSEQGTADDDYRLSLGSAAIDAGDNGPIADIRFDLDGGPRFLDDPSHHDSGIGAPPIVDLGAYEFCFADRAGHGRYVKCQHGPDVAAASNCHALDLDLDGRVDLADFAELQASYCGRY